MVTFMFCKLNPDTFIEQKAFLHYKKKAILVSMSNSQCYRALASHGKRATSEMSRNFHPKGLFCLSSPLHLPHFSVETLLHSPFVATESLLNGMKSSINDFQRFVELELAFNGLEHFSLG